MERLVLNWNVIDINEDMVERYCHNCGRKTTFMDSGKRRHNANGKNIYLYAIYKCANDHSWNKTLNIYKSYNEVFSMETSEEVSINPPAKISLPSIMEDGFVEVEILLDTVLGKHRLDKLLSLYIDGLSRTKIKNFIQEGKIKVNGTLAEPAMNVQSGHKILITL